MYEKSRNTVTPSTIYFCMCRRTLPLSLILLLAAVYEVGARAQELTFRGHETWVTSVQLSHDGKVLISGGDDGAVKAWDTRDEKLLWSVREGRNAVTAVACSADG